MKTSVLALSALVIGLSIAFSVKAAPQSNDRSAGAVIVQSEAQAAGWTVEAVLHEEPLDAGNNRPVDVFAPRPIPEHRLNIRRVGPRFFPDPANALDLGR